MGSFINLVGQTFGRLIVVERLEGKGQARWKCKCKCGNETGVYSQALRKGLTQSCGCLQKESASALATHKLSDSRLYNIWKNMKQRCFNSNHTAYMHYGGRGITVCDEWTNSFESFYKWAQENGYKDNLTLDRADNDGSYTPSNCRWATKVKQSSNTRRNIIIEIDGVSKTLTEWAKENDINTNTIYGRYTKGKRGKDLIKPTRVKGS